MGAAEIADDQGQRARGDRQTIEIAGADLIFRSAEVSDPVLTGAQIANAAGFRDANAVVVLQQLPNFELEELRPTETTYVRQRGIERFIVVEADRTLAFVLDGLRLVWPLPNPTARILKRLVGKGDDFELIQELEDQPDRVFGDDERVNLDGRGPERFRTRPRVRHVNVTYNNEPRTLEARIYTTEELRRVFGVEEGYELDVVAEGGSFEPLKPGQKTRVKEGMVFVSHAPCGGSS